MATILIEGVDYEVPGPVADKIAHLSAMVDTLSGMAALTYSAADELLAWPEVRGELVDLMTLSAEAAERQTPMTEQHCIRFLESAADSNPEGALGRLRALLSLKPGTPTKATVG